MKALALPDVADLVGPAAAARDWLDEERLRGRIGANLASGTTRELWKYTPLRGFLDALAGCPAQTPLPRLEHADQPGLRAVPLADLDDVDAARVRDSINQRLEGERHPLADLVLLRARGGWLIDVRGEPAQALEIHNPRHGIAPVFLRLEAGAELTVIEHHHSEGFLAQITHADLEAGARLRHYRAALERDVAHYSLVNVHLDRDAAYELNQSLVGGKRRRADVHVVVDGTGAQTDFAGAYLVEDGQHLDQQLVVEHRAGHSRSRQKFHGIGAGKGRSVFNGRIHIHRGAPQSDAELSNRNLALHPDAEMNTKPELEIYTDDVRCAHGATVGQMSAEALFYLTARGIPEAEARRLLSHGFVRECLAGPLAEMAAARFREALS
ncbi:MAG: Fe-S cluster assembly protein SufD [Pseudomonadales bacterium]